MWFARCNHSLILFVYNAVLGFLASSRPEQRPSVHWYLDKARGPIRETQPIQVGYPGPHRTFASTGRVVARLAKKGRPGRMFPGNGGR